MKITFYTTISSTNKNAIEITGCSPNVSHLVIPSVIDGHPVISIAKMAFRNRQDLLSIKIEEGMRDIGVESFADCCHLEVIQLPDSIRRISTQAFRRCLALRVFNGPKELQKLENSAFQNCQNLTSVTLKKQVTHLGNFAFAGCEHLTDFSMEQVPFFVGENCFSHTPLLHTDHHGVVSVQDKIVTEYSGNAAQILLPDTVETIAYGAFRDHYMLQQITCGKKLKSIGPCAFEKCTQLKHILQCEQLSHIYAHAFEQCTNLLMLPASAQVTYLGPYSFAGCKSLQKLLIYPKLPQILQATFADCTGATQVYFPSGLTHIHSHAFENCVSMQSLQFPGHLIFVDSYAFSGCNSLHEVVFPESLKEMGIQIFQNCRHLCQITVPFWNYPMGFLGDHVSVTLRFVQNSRTALYYSDDLARFRNGGRAKLALSLYHAPEHISFSEYDSCFDDLLSIPDKILFALNRLRYPTDLSPEKNTYFRTYLTDHAVQAVSICALLEDLDAVRFLCEDSFLTAKTLTEAIDLVNSSKHPAVISILMEYKKAPAETDAFESLFSF